MDSVAYLVVRCELVFDGFQLCDTRYGDGPVHHVVLLEEFFKHLCGAQRVDIWSDEENNGGGGCEWRAAMSGKDARVSIAVGWP